MSVQQPPLYPFFFEPILKRALWGGRRLGTVLGRSIGAGSDFAESWDLSDWETAQSRVRNGALRAISLHELVQNRTGDLFGLHRDYARFPILVKLIDACQTLSVQVHPPDGPQGPGKTEAWVVLETQGEAEVFAGLKEGIRRSDFERTLHQGSPVDCLHRISVKPGDCIFIEPGTVHAIGQGVLLSEIQQTSDTTYRVFDWNRLAHDGKPRTLHIREALEYIRFDRGPVECTRACVLSNGTETLVKSDYFTLVRRTCTQECHVGSNDRFHIIQVIRGQGKLRGAGSGDDLRVGDTVLIPASVGSVCLEPQPEMTVLDVWVPDPQ